MKRKIIAFVLISGFIGGVLGLVISARVTRAGFFDDLLHLFQSGIISPTVTSTAEASKEEASAPVPDYKPALAYEEAVIAAVEKASPSVVSIVITKDLPVIEQCPYNPFGDLPPELRGFFDFPSDSQFYRPCERGTKRQEVGGGSGFIVSSDGLIVTNKHVVADGKADYTVLTNDGKRFPAKVLARDTVLDLALLKIDANNLSAATLGDSDSIRLGQSAIAIGNALGEFRNTVSVGVISGLARTITASGQGVGSETIQGVIQTDAAINPGNSGGPLLNLRGEVIGINTAIASGAQNIGFAIPINQAKRAIESVKKTGTIKTPYIGVRYLMITEEIAKAQHLPLTYGALVQGTESGPGVIAESPAAKAGILAEDIIYEMNGERIDAENPLGFAIQKFNVGDIVTLSVQRGKKTLSLLVTLEKRPAL